MSFYHKCTQQTLLTNKRYKPVLDKAIAGDIYFELGSDSVYQLDYGSRDYKVQDYPRYRFFRDIPYTKKGNKVI